MSLLSLHLTIKNVLNCILKTYQQSSPKKLILPIIRKAKILITINHTLYSKLSNNEDFYPIIENVLLQNTRKPNIIYTLRTNFYPPKSNHAKTQ